MFCNGSACIEPRTLLPDEILPENVVNNASAQSPARDVSRNYRHDVELNVAYDDVGLGTLRNHLTDSADAGDSEAQRRLAEMYHSGLGGPEQIDDAMRYYRMASDQGDVQASLALADLLIEEQPENYDPTEIRFLLEEAARDGTPLAQVKFGAWLQLQGEDANALNWYTMAAEQEDLEGIFRMAGAYRDGVGTAQDLVRARHLFGAAASRGHAPAETQLAEMLLRGHGGHVNEQEAIGLFESASLKDYGPALLSSAKLYRDGTIVERDAEKAYERGRRAAELGIAEAIDMEPNLLSEFCHSTDVTCVSVPILYMTDREDTGSENLDARFANERENHFGQHDGANSNLHYGLVMVTVPARRRISARRYWSAGKNGQLVVR